MFAARTLAAFAAVLVLMTAGARAEPVPIGVGGLPHAGNDEESAISKELGLNFITESAPWDEPKEGDYAWADIKDPTDDPFGERLRKLKGQGCTLSVTLKVVDDDKKHMPFYLEGKPLDDPKVLARWQAFLKAFLERYGDSIDYLNFGQKVNAYFAKHEAEWPAFAKFVAAGVQVARKDKPKLSVGVGLKDTDDPVKYWRDLAPGCGHLALAYMAPCSVFTKQPTSQAIDPRQGVYFGKVFDSLLRLGGKKLLLTEVGCTSHASLDSSPEIQAQFITALFAWLRQSEGRVAAVSYICDKDWPYEASKTALRQALGDDILKYRGVIRLLTSEGLRFEDGKKKPAYDAFKKAVELYRGKR